MTASPLEPLIINAAITGMVPMPADNASVPITVEQIVAEAGRCATAGASIIHVHAREAGGAPTWRREIYQEIIDGIRGACPELLISASTSGRLWSDFERRSAVLDCRPDFGSLTPGSMNFPGAASVNPPEVVQQLAAAMTERGVMPELEFFELGMIDFVRDFLLPKGWLRPPLYANLLLGSLGTMAASARNLVHLVDALPPGTVWSAAGIGRYQFQINTLALAMGGHVRVGLEDNLWMDAARTDPATNVRLIERIAKVAAATGRAIATPPDARRLLGLAEAR
ncbi:MAG: 3-keto-5-aminohexanoate cleavage protein [Verrucomicrobiota bacterium]|nr:3-keto-5-aminohexanoate cleavage protein [Verrucomicrobiota bacterium]MCC6819657.1 3-keto-5-aminohexanoate cleavage protein [Limisphaerales bacterium]